MMNLAQNVKITRALNAVAAGQTAQNGAVIDMANFDGVVFLAAFGALDAGAVTGLKAQQGLQANLSDAADLAGAALASPIRPTTSSWCWTSSARPSATSAPW
jgi:hypothetical protein